MKLELKENMYIRTKDGIIAKVDYIEDNTISFDKGLYRTYDASIDFLEKDNLERIVKASYNIIDLIEKNDYINGLWVNEIVDGKPIHEDYNDPFYSFGWENDDIKSVITHEQMEQIAYKVEE